MELSEHSATVESPAFSSISVSSPMPMSLMLGVSLFILPRMGEARAKKAAIVAMIFPCMVLREGDGQSCMVEL